MDADKRREIWMFLLGGTNKNTSGEKESIFIRERKRIYDLYLEIAKEEVCGKVKSLIEKDMARTELKEKNELNDSNKSNDSGIGFLEQKKRRESVSRILLVYASTNKTVGYVQGMNWICSILYYALSSRGKKEEYAESITYFCFFRLMVDLGDLFSDKMDDSVSGINGQTEKVVQLVRKYSKKLYIYIEQVNLIGSSSFLLRWMLLLLSAELSLEDTLFLWDRLFSEHPKHRMIPFICAAALISSKKQILGKPLHISLTYLQNPVLDIKKIIISAEKIMQKERLN